VDKPKLRWPLRVTTVPVSSLNNTEGFLIQCPNEIASPIVVPVGLKPVLTLCDGNLTTDQIIERLGLVGEEEKFVRGFINLLDESLLLDNARFRISQNDVYADYRSLADRVPFLSGKAYPQEKESLRVYIQGLLREGSSNLTNIAPREHLSVIVSPHLDYHRGGRCYGAIFSQLEGVRQTFKEASPIVVLIGTSHQYSEGLFHLSTKNFLNPIKNFTCERGFVADLIRAAKALGAPEESLLKEEIVHRSEHSLELQLPFLAETLPQVTIVPILVGSFHSFVDSTRRINEDYEYNCFVAAFVQTYQTWSLQGRTIILLAGVDMAHVGAQFGDSFALTDEFMAQVESKDTQYLNLVCNHDTKGLFEHIAVDGDARRICGFPTLYTILDIFDRLRKPLNGRVIQYHQTVNYERTCGVTCAGAMLFSTGWE
jgi:AmmeMemoRadiSam system protein B